MIVNAYAILVGFVCLLQLLLGLFVTRSAVAGWRACRGTVTVGERESIENRTYLLLLLAVVLLGLNVASWPLLYLLLQSYVPSWPRVMCIYGVTQIGVGSLGSSRHLPWLLTVLQATKPALVFLSGGWFVLYLANRRTRTGPLLPRLMWWLIPVGLLSVCDSVCEASYLLIPKKEETLSVGCCVGAFDGLDGSSRFVPGPLMDAGGRVWLGVAFFGTMITMAAGLALALVGLLRRGRIRRGALAGLLAGAVISIPLGIVFLVEIGSPVLLQRPHHCPWDLIAEVPESVLAVALFVLGCFSVGWAAVAGWLGEVSETQAGLPTLVGRVLFLGLFGYLGSLVMLSLELVLS